MTSWSSRRRVEDRVALFTADGGAGIAAKGRYCNAPWLTTIRRFFPSRSATGPRSIWLNASAVSRKAGAAKPGRFDSEAKNCREDSSRSEEHTSELQSRLHLVCRLLL